MAKSKSKLDKTDSTAKGVDEALGRFAQADAEAAGDEADPLRDARVRLVERDGTGHPLLIYSTAKGMHVDLAYRGSSLWATQDQMAEMFGVDRTSITKHLGNIYDEGELEKATTCEETSQVRQEGQRLVRRNGRSSRV